MNRAAVHKREECFFLCLAVCYRLNVHPQLALILGGRMADRLEVVKEKQRDLTGR